MIKILILAGELDRDHTDQSVSPWLDRLERNGLAVQVLCLSRGHNPADHRLIEAPALDNRWVKGLTLRRLWSDSRLQRPDMMHLIDHRMVNLALAISQNERLPYVQTISHFATLERGLRLSRQWCRCLIATSHDLAMAMTDGLGIPAARITVIPPGIVLPQKPFRGVGAWKIPVIGAGGPFEETSGLMTFLDAAGIVVDSGYDVEFVVATQSGRHAELRRRANQLQIADRVTVGEYRVLSPQLWNVLDIYCQPATVASSGLTLGRALAHAVPCIATNVSGLRAWIQTGANGLIIGPDDARALANAIVLLIDNPEEARRLGQNGFDSIHSRFHPDVEAHRLATLYRKERQS